MKHKPVPKILRPFDDKTFNELREHIRHIRRAFDWPGANYHDVNEPESNRFNRWFWHNLPHLVELHHSPDFIKLVSDHFGIPLKPSYAFLSMYGPEGVCPVHTDRPQCQFTVDIQVDSDGLWPIIVDEVPFVLQDGEALAYSGTGQVHYRQKMREQRNPTTNEIVTSSEIKEIGKLIERTTFMNLAFFHFVPTSWMGKVD